MKNKIIGAIGFGALFLYTVFAFYHAFTTYDLATLSHITFRL